MDLNDRMAELDSVTREYARFSRSAGGLSAVLGGALWLASSLAGALWPGAAPIRAALIAMPFVWLAARLVLTRTYYQRLGRVEQLTTPAERRVHALNTFAITVILALVLAPELLIGHPRPGYVSLVLLLPVAVWFWMRTPAERGVGTFLFCQAALASTGRALPLILSLLFLPAAVILVLTGFRDHRRFLLLGSRLRAITDDGR